MNVSTRRHAGVLACAALLGAALFALVPADADAANRYWNSKSSPLTAYDGGKAKAQGYGYWKIGTTQNGTRSQAFGYLRDADTKNGYKVYFQLRSHFNAGYCVQPKYTSCNATWYAGSSAHSEFNKETWGSSKWSGRLYTSTGVSGAGSYARAQMQVAESNKGPDSFSGSTYTLGNKY